MSRRSNLSAAELARRITEYLPGFARPMVDDLITAVQREEGKRKDAEYTVGLCGILASQLGRPTLEVIQEFRLTGKIAGIHEAETPAVSPRRHEAETPD